MARLSIGVSADAKEAASEFKALAEDIKKVGTESVGVTEGVARVDAALQKLANAPDTPMALARATAKAKLEIDELRAALEKTPASAEAMKSIGAALAKADQALESTIKRAGKLGEAQEEVKQRMGLTAKGAESLGNSFGSLDGIMGKMADSSSATSQAVAKLGFSVVAAGQAFELGYSTGEKFRKGLEGIGIKIPDLSDKLAKLVVSIEGSVRGYEKAELVESAAMNRAKQIIALREAQAVSERALADFQAKNLGEWKDADAARIAYIDQLSAIEMKLRAVKEDEEAYQSTIRENAALLNSLADAQEKHNVNLVKVAPLVAFAANESREYVEVIKAAKQAEADFSAANEKVLDILSRLIPAMKGTTSGYGELEAGMLKLAATQNISLTDLEKMISAEMARSKATGETKAAYEALLGAIDRIQAKGVDTTKQIDEEIEARRKLNQAIKDSEAAANAEYQAKLQRWAAEDAARNRTSKAPQQFKEIQDAAFGAAVAAGELGTNLDNVAEAVVATGGTMTVGPPIWITYAQATREATQALLDFAVASKAVREEQAEAMTVTKGWTDYILTLKDGYESGITSLYNYVTALGSFKTQLQQMFAGAHGDAKDALEGIIALIDKLVQTAGAGTNGQFGTPDFSPLRQLEREFGQ